MSDGLKTRMRAGSPLIGCWIHLFDRLAAEIVGRAGYDFVMIDLEHGPGDVMSATSVMQALGPGCRPLVRVPGNDALWIKRVLDAGAEGVMVPSVNSREEAAAAAAACHYAPRGMRGMAAVIVRAANYGADWQDYVRRIEDELLVICQIESAKAVDRIEEITAVEDVDLLFIGPFDLSQALGGVGQVNHDKVWEAIDRVAAACRRHNKPWGTVPAGPDYAARCLDLGCRMLTLANETLALRRGVEALKESYSRFF